MRYPEDITKAHRKVLSIADFAIRRVQPSKQFGRAVPEEFVKGQVTAGMLDHLEQYIEISSEPNHWGETVFTARISLPYVRDKLFADTEDSLERERLDNDRLREQIKYLEMPWYKKLFK